MKIVITTMKVGTWDRLKAFFSLTIYTDNMDTDGITIKGCKLVEGENGLFVSSPAEKKEVDGETKYFPLIWFGKDILKQIQHLAIEEYEKKANNVENVTIEDLPNL